MGANESQSWDDGAFPAMSTEECHTFYEQRIATIFGKIIHSGSADATKILDAFRNIEVFYDDEHEKKRLFGVIDCFLPAHLSAQSYQWFRESVLYAVTTKVLEEFGPDAILASSAGRGMGSMSTITLAVRAFPMAANAMVAFVFDNILTADIALALFDQKSRNVGEFTVNLLRNASHRILRKPDTPPQPYAATLRGDDPSNAVAPLALPVNWKILRG